MGLRGIAAALVLACHLHCAGAFAPSSGVFLWHGSFSRGPALGSIRGPTTIVGLAPSGGRLSRVHSEQSGRRAGVLDMTSSGAGEATPSGGKKQAGLLNALYKFTRPHTIRGTILASCACVTRVLLDCIREMEFVEWRLLRIAVVGLFALLCGNAYIVGINQIYDVDIDKVNKPFLPVAAGEISKPLAWTLVAGTGVAGLALVYSTFSPVIAGLYCVGMLLGTVYTVPPFRWKNNAVLAAFSIAMVRGLLLNVGLHQAASNALGLPCTWPPQVLFIASFMTVFAVVIAIAKDLPDVEGDREYKVKTLAATWGVGNAARLVEGVLMGNYAMGIAVGLLAPGVNTPLLVGAHLGLAGFLRAFSSRLDPNSVPSIKLFYRNIWKLFYAEYLLFPFF